MTVTFRIASHSAEAVSKSNKFTSSPSPVDILQSLSSQSSSSRKNAPPELLQSSFHPTFRIGNSETNDLDISKLDLLLEDGGFAQTVLRAYNCHHHLVIRPDDVWIAILSQLNLYINHNAESLRSHFVTHQGKKPLEVHMNGTRYTADFGDLSLQMADQIQDNIIDSSLKDWVLPDFSTTTPNDSVICAVMLMSVMQTYFEYNFIWCGIPSITLKGTKADWEKILQRIDRLPTFGERPKAWAALLRPILKRFIQTFDVVQNPDPTSPDNVLAEGRLRDFYSKVVSQYSLGSGSNYLSGWITAFCVWNRQGEWQGSPPPPPPPHKGGKSRKGKKNTGEHPKLVIDGVRYPIIAAEDVPMGTCTVEEVRVHEPGGITVCSMIAGHVANVVEGKGDTLRPLASWFIYVKPPSESTEEEG